MTSDDELLRRWEDRIVSAGDPLGALADVLSGRREQRIELFRQVGRTLLGCRLESILGAGGVGVTYLATATDGTRAAVKLVSGVGEQARARFEQECRTLRTLDHPAIVRYRDHVVLPDGTGVLVMDFVDGVDLERLLVEVPVVTAGTAAAPWATLLHEVASEGLERLRSPRVRRRVLRLLATVADGLHAAHAQGIVHRDVKPANVLVDHDLQPVLIDFGLARDQQVRASLTASGAAMGTLAYMAPEQLGRDPGAVDARTDVYALGLVLYRALVGEDLRQEVAAVVRAGKRPFLLPAAASSVLPVEVQAILYRCLERHPAQRYASAAALASDLRAAAGHGAVQAKLPGRWRRFVRDRRRLGAAIVALVLVVVAGIVWSWPRGREVVFAANANVEDVDVLLADGPPVLLGQAVWLPYGNTTARFQGSRTPRGAKLRPVEVEFEVVPAPGQQRVPALIGDVVTDTQFVRPGHATVFFMSGHSWTQMAPGVDLDRRRIGDQQIDDRAPYFPQGVVLPGRHTLLAIDGKGREERQVLRLHEGVSDVQMLPACMSAIDGQFRRTWSTVMSPRTEDVSVTGAHEVWIGRSRTSVIGGGGVEEAECALVAGAAHAPAEVVLRCRFPNPMRTAVVYLRGSAREGAGLEVQAGFAGAPMQAWPIVHDTVSGDRRLVPWCAFRCDAGSEEFVVRARMQTNTAPIPGRTAVRFLDGAVYGGHWRDEPPCFAIVADPGDAAVLPRVDAGVDLKATPRWRPDEAGRLPSSSDIFGLVPVLEPRGNQSLLVSSRESGRGVVTRRSWPGLIEHQRWSAATAAGADGVTIGRDDFGGWVAALPDLDGDGRCDLAIGETTHERQGVTHAGRVAMFQGSNPEPVWTWPSGSFGSEFGNDDAGVVLPVGDWNGDGAVDLVVGAQGAGRPPVQEKAGRIEVLDARRGTVLAGWSPQRARAFAQPIDVFVVPGSKPRLLVGTKKHQEENDNPGDIVWQCWNGGEAAPLAGEILTPRNTQAAWVGPTDGAGEVALVVLRAAPWADGFVGARRYLVIDGGWHVEREQRVQLPAGMDCVEELRRIGDVDGDGTTDLFAVTLARSAARLAFVLSGQSLQVLGHVPLPAFQIGQAIRSAWIPPSADKPGALLVAGLIDGQGVVLYTATPP